VLDATLPVTTDHVKVSGTPLDRMLAMFSPQLHTPTSLAALHTAVLHSLLRRTAVDLGAEILLLGSSATRLAVRTLSSMAEGGGYSMGEDVGVEYTLNLPQRHAGAVEQGGKIGSKSLLVTRPLGRVLYKELAYFARSRGLECLTMERPSTGVDPKAAGISALVEGEQLLQGGPRSPRLHTLTFTTRRFTRFSLCSRAGGQFPIHRVDHYPNRPEIGYADRGRSRASQKQLYKPHIASSRSVVPSLRIVSAREHTNVARRPFR
jgi:hypothetical protein